MTSFLRIARIPDPAPGQIWLSPIGKPMLIAEVERDSNREIAAILVVYANWVFEDGWDRKPTLYARSRSEWRKYLREERRYLK